MTTDVMKNFYLIFLFLTKNNGSPNKLNGFTSPIFGKELATPITVHLFSNIFSLSIKV